MRGDHGSPRHLDHVPERLVRDVRDVDQHAEPVHLAHHLAAEVGETAVAPDVARGIGPAVAVAPGERHVADAEVVEVLDVLELVLDRVTSLQAHQAGDLAGGGGIPDVLRAHRERQAAGVPDELAQQRLDHLDRARAVLAGPPAARIRPDREELRVDAPALESLEIRVRAQLGSRRWRQVSHQQHPRLDALLAGIGAVHAEIEPAVQNPDPDVVVAVDYDRVAMDLRGSRTRRRGRIRATGIAREREQARRGGSGEP